MSISVADLWLENFRTEDEKNLARKLLQEFIIIPQEDINNEIISAIDEIISLNTNRKIILLPVIEREQLADVRPDDGGDQLILWGNKKINEFIKTPEGSEGSIMSIIGEFTRSKSKRFKNSDIYGPNCPVNYWLPSKTSPIKKDCLIVFITDLSFSGDQIIDFANGLKEDNNIKHGIRDIAFEIVVGARTNRAIDKVAEELKIDIFSGFHIPVIEELEDRDSLQALCKQYCLCIEKKNCLGYKDVGALFATSEKISDNIPKIFTQSPKDYGNAWTALFEGRYGQKHKIKRFSDNLSKNHFSNMARMTRIQIKNSEFSKILVQDYLLIVDFMAFCDKGNDIVKIQRFMGQSGTKIRMIKRWCVHNNFLKEDFQLTEEGRRALGRVNRANMDNSKEPVRVQPKRTRQVDMREEFYYPITMR